MSDPVTWSRVGRALLGRWPSQVAQWGEDGIAAFVEELQADGLSAEQALVALRMHRPPPDKDFPPSVAAVSALAYRDPSRPTFDELLAGLYEPGGVFGFKRSSAPPVSPWVLAFVERHGRERLRLLEINDPVEGKWRRRELEQSWTAFLEANEGRAVAEIAARSGRGSLSRVDPLAAIGGTRKEIPEEASA